MLLSRFAFRNEAVAVLRLVFRDYGEDLGWVSGAGLRGIYPYMGIVLSGVPSGPGTSRVV